MVETGNKLLRGEQTSTLKVLGRNLCALYNVASAPCRVTPLPPSSAHEVLCSGSLTPPPPLRGEAYPQSACSRSHGDVIIVNIAHGGNGVLSCRLVKTVTLQPLAVLS